MRAASKIAGLIAVIMAAAACAMVACAIKVCGLAEQLELECDRECQW